MNQYNHGDTPPGCVSDPEDCPAPSYYPESDAADLIDATFEDAVEGMPDVRIKGVTTYEVFETRVTFTLPAIQVTVDRVKWARCMANWACDEADFVTGVVHRRIRDCYS